MDYAIQTFNLGKSFDGKSAIRALDLKIKKGEIYGFLGANGAGKSTTIKMLVTLLKPTEGRAEILGKDIIKDQDFVRFSIGVALQEASLDETQTGRELLTLQALFYGLTRKEAEARVEELLKLIDIGEFIDKKIKTYSGGMKRRVDLAAALIHKPSILFLDEPTTGLDPINRALVWAEVKKLNQDQGMTIFLTTQYLEEADALADRVGIISEGTIVVEDSPAALKKRIGKEQVIISSKDFGDSKILKKIKSLDKVDNVEIHGPEMIVSTTSGSDLVAGLVTTLQNEGVKINEVRVRGTTLDDVFLEVTGKRLEV